MKGKQFNTSSKLGSYIIKAQEEERRRLAREMHDGPAQVLANIIMRVEICERLLASGRAEVAQELSQMKLVIKDSLREVRKTIFDLRPMMLDELGIIANLHRYIEQMGKYDHVETRLCVHGEERRLEPTVEVAIFRTVQEAIRNANRHAQATQIDVIFQYHSQTLDVQIVDDGVGFDVNHVRAAVQDRSRYGLIGMEERIELLGGTFTLRSEPHKGTRIHFTMPYEV